MRSTGGARGAVLACLSALLTGVGHVAGGGTVGDLGLLVVLLPLVAVVFVSLAERSRTPLGTVVVLAAGQVALHYLMVLLHSSADAGPALLGGPSMLAMHAIVTLLSAVGLRHADHAVAAVAAAFRRVVPRRLAPPPVERPPTTFAVPGPELPARLASAFLGAATRRRGPPVWC
ncbi:MULTISPECIES: hypothetical protein [unclassified Pseudonocardia]|jgi:hypothetical protein|uniref:hypothetical protein n=1 Tax=unclassified Pseudonocardia TaxID=2619320 RepID=UPI0009662C41|nr:MULTISPECIES: hypothetical protein [unclassified Pseudonocardia]MBN9096573.1 hypothetical protein [Pseudonocardia sp.]OJY47412.1 MAG: hypothetical protein BGP03_30435 [Pseudonocardia sp. 73-21]